MEPAGSRSFQTARVEIAELEISPQLIEFAEQRARNTESDPAIELGNLDDNDIGRDKYDIIIWSKDFAHGEHSVRVSATFTAL